MFRYIELEVIGMVDIELEIFFERVSRTSLEPFWISLRIRILECDPDRFEGGLK